MLTTTKNPLSLCVSYIPCRVEQKIIIRAFHSLGTSTLQENETLCLRETSTDEGEFVNDSCTEEMAVEIKEIPGRPPQNAVDVSCLVYKCNQHRYQEDSYAPASLVLLLKACTEKQDMHRGSQIHSAVVRRGLLQQNVFLGSTLVNMYAKCGALAKAQEVFNELRVHNVVVWNSLITGYVQQGFGEEALKCLEKMQLEGLHPDALTFTCILKACGGISALAKGQELHIQAVQYGLLEEDLVVGTALVDMYTKCGHLEEARRVFDDLQMQDTITWNALLAGYAQHGYGEEALSCFERMRLGGFSPNAVTFVCLLTACGSIGASERGQNMHGDIVRHGLQQNNEVGTAVLVMYLKCGLLEESEKVLKELSVHNEVSWSAFIVGCVQQGYGEKAIGCFTRMHCEGLSSNVGTLACILKACGIIGALNKGREIHAQISVDGLLEKEMIVGTALVDMYATCGVIGKAQEVFDNLPDQDVVLWTTLIGGYTDHGRPKEALNCFERMQLTGPSPNASTFVYALKACGSIGALVEGQKLHAQIVRNGFLAKNIANIALVDMCTEEVFSRTKAGNKGQEIHAQIRRGRLLERDVVVGTALLDMYVKCGMLTEGRDMFDELSIRDLVLWNALISGYAQHAHVEEALNCYECMQLEGVSPDSVTSSCILKVCGSVGSVHKGCQVHDGVLKTGLLEHDTAVGNALVDMYANCGTVAEAHGWFDKLAVQDIISWNALLAGYAQIGNNNVFYVFDKMIEVGQSPDTITFVCVLNACSHMGLLEKGQYVLEAINRSYNVDVTTEHYNCIVGSLGRAHCIDKIVAVIKNMPFSANFVMWHTVLGACQNFLDVQLGRWAFEHAIELDEEDVEAYVCMGNILAAAGRHEVVVTKHAVEWIMLKL